MSKLIVGVLLWTLSGSIAAQTAISGPSTLAFVQKHKGLYASEISDERPFSQSFTTRINIAPYRIKVAYDDGSKTITITTDQFQSLQMQEVFESCTKRGTATGTTAMGVTASFVKQTCHRIFIKGNDDKWLGDKHQNPSASYLSTGLITLPGNPKQYRDLLARGFDIAVTFTPIKSDSVVVEHDQAFHSAKIDYRYETHMNVYKFSAKVHRIDYFFAGAKIPFRVDRFD